MIPGVHFEWEHPVNPTEVRVSPDGRVAFCLVVYRDGSAAEQWLYLDSPNGQLQMTTLQQEDVQDWTVTYSA